MPTVRDLQADPAFHALSLDAKRIVLDRVASEDREFQALSPEAQGLIRTRLLGQPGAPSEAAPAGGPSLVGAVAEAPGVALRTFVGGFGRLKEAVAPSAEAPPRSVGARALEALGGLGDVLSLGVPASVGHVTGAAMERLVRTSGELTDEALRQRLDRARENAPGEVPLIEQLLALPYEERVARARAGGAAQGELLGGFAPVGAAGRLA
ncbi:MAG TPA: hypothetical protein VNM66_03120, partial [Thermodesulfobacteriota bacterium]|nr:hypothetical protein [Thermodesulfobacteriota bacterium]